MQVKIVGDIAVVNSETALFTDAQSALDLMVSVGYEHSVTKVAVNKTLVGEDFFRLSTGFAGEVMQKFANYGYRLAIIGDFTGYTSKALRDYIYECNNGRLLNFVKDEEEAVKRLS